MTSAIVGIFFFFFFFFFFFPPPPKKKKKKKKKNKGQAVSSGHHPGHAVGSDPVGIFRVTCQVFRSIAAT